MSTLILDHTISIGIIVTVAVQSAGVLIWGGPAESRLKALEKISANTLPVAERLVRLEEQMNMARQSLERIEQRLNSSPKH